MLHNAYSLLAAIAVFPLIIWIPGLALAFCTNVLQFRNRPVPTRMAMGLLFSMSTCPIIVYLLVRLSGFTAVWTFYGVVWVTAILLLLRHWRGFLRTCYELVTCHKAVVFLLLAWGVFIVCFEADWITPGGVRLNLVSMDEVTHVAFTNAVTRTGVPAVNPLIYPGFPVPLFYYYFWYILCSLVDQLGGSLVTARAAVQAGKFYIGLGLVSLIATYVDVLASDIMPSVTKIRKGVAIALLTVTGLDLIPWMMEYVLHNWLGKGPPPGLSIEWWNEQVTAWLGALLMSPHHPAATVVSCTGILLLICLTSAVGKQQIVLMAMASMAFASAAGMSLYVMFACAVGLTVWALVAVYRRWLKYVAQLAIVGLAAGCLYLPMALELKNANHLSGFPMAFAVRSFSVVDYWLPSILPSLKSVTGKALMPFLLLVSLPVNYFCELGFYFVTAILYWRWRRSTSRPMVPAEVLLACLAAGSILVCSFLRSTFRWNDLGWRGFLPAQFVLLLWSIPVIESILWPAENGLTVPRRWHGLVWLCLLVGIGGTVWEIVGMRIQSDMPQGPQTAGLREAYIWVDHHLPQNVVIMFNPDIPIEPLNSFYAYRQTLFVGRSYGTLMAVNASYERILDEAIQAFQKDANLSYVTDLCQRYHVGAVIARSTDPAWSNPSSWVWKTRTSFETKWTRVFTIDDLITSGTSFASTR